MGFSVCKGAIGRCCGSLLSCDDVVLEAEGIEDEEDAVDVGVTDSWGSNDFHLFAQGVFEF